MSKKKKIEKNKNKTVRSVNNNIRSSVRKLNPILRNIVGKKVDVAIRDLEFSEKRITKDISNPLWARREAGAPRCRRTAAPARLRASVDV